jgi:hypothetical protein
MSTPPFYPTWDAYFAAEGTPEPPAGGEIHGPPRDPAAGLEPGTNEWAYATGNYIDPEPDWDRGEPYLDHRHGVAYYDTQAAYEAGQDRYPDYQHVAPEPQPDPDPGPGESNLTMQEVADIVTGGPRPQPDLEAEAG